MGRIPDLRQLKKEDFDKDDQDMIGKLEFPVNNFMQQVINLFKNGIDFTNLNQQVVVFTASVDSTGTPVSTIQFKNTLSTKIIGIGCINAINKSSTQRYPASTPFISFTTNNNLITITNIAGLGIPAGQTNSDVYTFTIVTTGAQIPTS